jgi:hypothetical protein
MTYTDFIKKPISNKISIFEIDKGIQLDPFDKSWSKFTPDVWRFQYSSFTNLKTRADYGFGSYGSFPYGLSSPLKYGWGSQLWGDSPWGDGSIPDPEPPERQPTFFFGSLVVDGEQYTKAETLQDVYLIDKSFFFDIPTQFLYVNFEDNRPPTDFNTITGGITDGYASEEGYYDGVFFEGRLQSIPSITNTKDPLYFGLISFDGGSVQLINTDGHFDTLQEEDVYGQRVRIKFGSRDIDFSDYETIYSGFFESFVLTENNCTINIRDPRKNISRSVNTNLFNLTDYPLLDDGNDGEIIPLGYGEINKQPAICTNETDEFTPTYSFKICDTSKHTIQSIDKVFIEGKSVSFSGINLAEATFNLSNSVYEPGQDVTVSYTGYDISNPLDVIVDLLETYTDIAYTATEFNQTEWEYAKALVPDINLSIIESTKIIDIIGEISSTVQGVFIFQGDGKITFRLREPDRASSATLTTQDYLLPPSQTNPSEEFTSRIRVGYKRAWSNNKNRWYTDESREQELFEKFRSRRTREFPTLLVNEADAITFAADLYDQFGGIFPTFRLTTKTQFLSLQLEDNIDAEVYILPDGLYGKIKLEVIGIETDFNTNQMIITGRFLSYIDSPTGAKLIRLKAPQMD